MVGFRCFLCQTTESSVVVVPCEPPDGEAGVNRETRVVLFDGSGGKDIGSQVQGETSEEIVQIITTQDHTIRLAQQVLSQSNTFTK